MMGARITLLGAVGLVFCQACQSNVAGGYGTTGAPAYAAARATEPRTGDPTAAAAPPSPTASPTASAALGGKAAPPAPTTVSPSRAAPPSESQTQTTSGAPAASDGAAAATGPAEPPKQISARHVLIQWIGAQKAGKSVLRTREQALTVAEEVLKKAKAGADLGRLAAEYSDEPNADMRGGSLGRFGRGQMVPAFEQQAFKLRVGEISEIVETPFGFHVIQRTE